MQPRLMFMSHKEEDDVDEVEVLSDNDDDSSTLKPHSSSSDTNSNSNSNNENGSNNSNSNNSNTTTDNSNNNNAIAQSESSRLKWIRFMVGMALLTATVSVSAVMYTSLRQTEQQEFKDRFSEHSETILSGFQSHLQDGVRAMDIAAIDALGKDQEWPFVTVTDFEKRVAAIRSLGLFSSFLFMPVVSAEDRVEYEAFTNNNTEWLATIQAYEVQTGQASWEFGNFQAGGSGIRPDDNRRSLEMTTSGDGVMDRIWGATSEGTLAYREDDSATTFLPIYYHSPVEGFVNYDVFTNPSSSAVFQRAVDTKSITLTEAVFLSEAIQVETDNIYTPVPASTLIYPLLDQDQVVVGVISAAIYWDAYMQVEKLPSTAENIHLVLRNQCDQSYTFEVLGGDVLYVGEGDLHESDFEEDDRSFELVSLFRDNHVQLFGGAQFDESYCAFELHIYPTQQMKDRFLTNNPLLYTAMVVAVFVFTSMVFVGYDCLVERRQRVVLQTAERSHAIVSSLFPKNVRNRLLEGADNNTNSATNSHDRAARRHRFDQDHHTGPSLASQKAKLKSFVRTGNMLGETGVVGHRNRPIADLFSNTTVLFADISGFTAWSSTRDPSQVFTLLESIYGAFDKLADRRKVFKVETIGDSYMAVTGLPDPQADHAVIMAKFAEAALLKLHKITQDLEIELGPGTTELDMRFGLHSGPVTAGVLRGQKSRFQLFGDTVNTASRMESTGARGRIQCSQETVDCLVEHGKSHWVCARDDLVEVKGKGTTQTYWVESTQRSAAKSTADTASLGTHESTLEPSLATPEQSPAFQASSSSSSASSMSPQMQRLLEWNVDLLSNLLKRIVAHRMSSAERKPVMSMSVVAPYKRKAHEIDAFKVATSDPRSEYQEAIHLPHFVASASNKTIDPEDIELSPRVEEQLRDYVTKIAQSYRNNPFHNYDHASHVTMSVNKILARVVMADELDIGSESVRHVAAKLHDYSYGITSDPLTHFACVFAALIHDVDHPGISNSQLIKENDPMASMYGNKSVAEQNSLDLAWNLLMEDRYYGLRECLFHDVDTKKRFRQLLVNTVMSTDIFDPDLKALRNKRWDKAFSTTGNENGNDMDSTNHGDGGLSVDLKATIVIEHIIQAADVSHTMQHWHVYQKWNKRLFNEMYKAYKMGRLDVDPSEGWYKGELWFYDNYIIPLAKKLSECGVFGVSSDEFLNYATMNRSEWERKGEAIVEDLKAEFEATAPLRVKR